jgi:thioredoxin-related protein
VDRLEERFAPELNVVRMNVQDAATEPLARQYGVQHTPTFVLLDGQGKVLLRSVGAIDPQVVERLLSPAG